MPDWSKPETIRAALYSAVSREEQADPNLPSIPEQLRQDEDVCLRRSWRVVERIVIGGSSRWHSDLTTMCEHSEDYARMVDLIRGHRVDVVIGYAYHRLARTVSLMTALFALAREHGVWLYACTQPVEPGQWRTALWTATFGGLSAEEEIANLIERHRFGHIGRLKQGLSNAHATASYGYNREGERRRARLMPEPLERLHLHYMYERRAVETGIETICNELDDRGAVSPHEKRWAVPTVRQLLSNPVYVGMVRWQVDTERRNPEIRRRPVRCYLSRCKHPELDHGLGDDLPLCKDYCYPGLHEPLVEPELWRRVQTVNYLLAQNKLRHDQPIYLLSGLMRCGYCSASASYSTVVTRGLAYLYVQCRRQRNKRLYADSHCPAPTTNAVRAEEVHAFVLDRVKFYLRNPEAFIAVMEERDRANDQESRLKEAQDALSEVARRKVNLYDTLETGRLQQADRDTLLTRLGHLNEEQERHEGEIAALLAAQQRAIIRPDYLRRFKGLVGKWDTWSEAQWRPTVLDLIERIEIRRGEPPNIHWRH